MKKIKKIAGLLLVLWCVVTISYAGWKLYHYFFPPKEFKNTYLSLSSKVAKQQVFEGKKIILASKNVIKLVGYEEKDKKEYKYKDNEFYLHMTQINATDNVLAKATKNVWNSFKQRINNTGERRYYQTGYYDVAYGIDAKKNPIKIQSIDEKTGVIKIKKPVVSMLYFSMPYDKMQFEIEDRSDLSKGKIKITQEFTTEDRQKLYKDFVDRIKKELNTDDHTKALEGTKKAIQSFILHIEPKAKVEFVN